jgi:hypothetical protein
MWKVPDSGGPEIQVTTTGGENPMETSDGKYLYYGKQKSRSEPYVWCMSLANGGEEQLFRSQIDIESLAMGKRHLYFVGIPPANTRHFRNTIYSYDLFLSCTNQQAGLVVCKTHFPPVGEPCDALTSPGSPISQRNVKVMAAPRQ